MLILFDADIPVHYGFIFLTGADEQDRAELMDARAGQVNGLAGAAVPGQISLVTGLHTGRVPLVVRWHDSRPVIGDEWADVVEVSFEPPGADLQLSSFEDFFHLRLPAVRSLRARYCGNGMDAARDADAVFDGEPTIDRYLLDLWPAAPASDVIVRQSSEFAAYWHEETRTASAVQPGGTNRAAVRVQPIPAADQAAPPASMEAWQARGSLGSVTPAEQRAAARWLARLAAEKTGLTQVLPILDVLDRGEPLPASGTSMNDIVPAGASDRQMHAAAAVFSAAHADSSTAVAGSFRHAESAFGADRDDLMIRLRGRFPPNTSVSP